MGFNNSGVEEAINRLKQNKGVLIGGNIGKNKIKFDIKGWDEIEKKGMLKEFIRPKDLQDSKE